MLGSIDPLIGIGGALTIIVMANIVRLVVIEVVKLPEESDASNTQILSDANGSAWILLAVFVAVIGAPIVEELFFRGLILRVFERIGSHMINPIGGAVLGVLLSSAIFASLHMPDGGGWKDLVVLQAVIFTVGVVLGVVAVWVNRLGPTIFGHMYFNGLTVLFSLFS